MFYFINIKIFCPESIGSEYSENMVVQDFHHAPLNNHTIATMSNIEGKNNLCILKD